MVHSVLIVSGGSGANLQFFRSRDGLSHGPTTGSHKKHKKNKKNSLSLSLFLSPSPPFVSGRNDPPDQDHLVIETLA